MNLSRMKKSIKKTTDGVKTPENWHKLPVEEKLKALDVLIAKKEELKKQPVVS